MMSLPEPFVAEKNYTVRIGESFKSPGSVSFHHLKYAGALRAGSGLPPDEVAIEAKTSKFFVKTPSEPSKPGPTWFAGSSKHSVEQEFVLLYDPVTETFVLEKLDTTISSFKASKPPAGWTAAASRDTASISGAHGLQLPTLANRGPELTHNDLVLPSAAIPGTSDGPGDRDIGVTKVEAPALADTHDVDNSHDPTSEDDFLDDIIADAISPGDNGDHDMSFADDTIFDESLGDKDLRDSEAARLSEPAHDILTISSPQDRREPPQSLTVAHTLQSKPKSGEIRSLVNLLKANDESESSSGDSDSSSDSSGSSGSGSEDGGSSSSDNDSD
ncbi:uncharacterized protein BJ171DRAFT_516537 [Polychytrium aggregatum]|uniref:uncharacterized protein n=1 Tax=Polychytrium aggregatum TaxID=110093 RepID=UPI0022FE6213|nr:uncharacterized protein BJ171DRAFT_516537 [Polychytrium aggregatum]KAI9201797.1 hypothetical protein BJ171DRAFT_516537 [Polychytrium aggregatum]